MPALLSTLDDAKSEPLMAQLAPFWPADRVLARMLVAMSDEAVRIAGRKLAIPPSVSLTAAASTGATTLALDDASNIFPGDVLRLPSGETIEVEGAEITDFTVATPPYPGSVYLTAPIASGVAQAATAQVLRQEQYVVRGRATDPMDESVLISQDAQLAQAHAPMLQIGGFSRRLFVRESPLWSVQAAFYILPFSGQDAEIEASRTNWTALRYGTIKLPIGFPNYLGTIWRLQYVAGYRVIPYDIRQAVHNLLANEVAKAMNPIGGWEIRSDDQMARMTRPSSTTGQPPPMAHHVEEAYRVLRGYRPRGI